MGMNRRINSDLKQIGPYRIENILGKGGMGVVYRAHHVETGDVVALKTIFAPSQKQLSSIQREIRALACIRHPGVVRIIDEGVENRLPWYAMELLEGLTLDQYFSQELWEGMESPRVWSTLSTRSDTLDSDDSGWWKRILGTTLDTHLMYEADYPDEGPSMGVPRPLDGELPAAAGGQLPEVLGLIFRICQTLAYLHGEGIIHRDLKPSNIVIRENGVPVVMDFGLSTEFWRGESREGLDTASLTGGTLQYISPEQLRGELVDARADLYSLGCIIYELITGRHPYYASSISQMIQAHLSIRPVKPSLLVKELPEELDELMIRLLAKNPRSRVGHADDIAATVARLGADIPEPSDLPRPKPFLYRPRFTGRREVLETVTGHLEALQDGRGCLILVEGESGIGKTRMLLEFVQAAVSRRMPLFFGECLPQGGLDSESDPFEPLKTMIQKVSDRCLQSGKSESDRIFGPRGRIMAEYFPDILRLPGQSVYPAPASLPPEAMHMRLYNSITQTFRAVVQRDPALLLMDDLQWADAMTIGLVEFMLRIGYFENTAFVIMGTFRSEELTKPLMRMIKHPRTIHLKLDTLNADAMKKIVCDMLAVVSLPDDLADLEKLFTHGNPFFVMEYLRICLDSGQIRRSDKGSWELASPGDSPETGSVELRMPESVVEVIDRRLTFLSDNAKTVLSAAAIIGREIDMMLLFQIVPYNVANLDALNELLNKNILEEIDPGKLQFTQNVMHQSAYERITEKDRRDLHRKTAGMLESGTGIADKSTAAIIASHWEAALAMDKARDYYLDGARRAVNRYSMSEAEGLFRSCLDLVETPTPEFVKARNEFAHRVLLFLGRPKEALEQHQLARVEARDIGDERGRLQSLSGMISIFGQLGELDRASELWEEMVNNTADLEPEWHATAQMNLGSIHLNQGDFKSARTLYENAFKIYRDCKDISGEADTLANLGALHISEGDFKTAKKVFNQSLAIHREIKERHYVANDIKGLALAYWLEGDLEKARHNLEESRTMFKALGDRQGEAETMTNLVLIHIEQHDYDRAISLAEQSLVVLRETGNRMMEGVTMMNYGQALFETGDVAGALEKCIDSKSILVEAKANHYLPRNYLFHAVIERITAGNYALADEYLAEGETVLDTIHDPLARVEYLCQKGHLALARGKPGDEYLASAEQLLADHPSDIPADLKTDIKKLKNAMNAREAGKTLFRGCRMTDIPAGVVKWLRQTGQLDQPSGETPERE